MSTFYQVSAKGNWGERWDALVKGLGLNPSEVYSMTYYRSGVVEVTTMEDLCSSLPKT